MGTDRPHNVKSAGINRVKLTAEHLWRFYHGRHFQRGQPGGRGLLITGLPATNNSLIKANPVNWLTTVGVLSQVNMRQVGAGRGMAA